MTMTGAELKTKLEGLGLPPSWSASRMNVTMRTVVRWFDLQEVSDEVVAEVDKLLDLTVAEMQKMVAKAPESGQIVLKTFRTDKEFTGKWLGRSEGRTPATWHRSLTFRVLDHFRSDGREVRVEYK
jgi:hypothetical protein